MNGTNAHAEILIVDDDDEIRETLRAILEDEGYRVAGACNGREAMDYLREAEPPTLILLDIMMPVMNGWQFCIEQQRDARLANIPVVVISAVSRSAREEHSLPAADYIEKPLNLDRLIDLISAVKSRCSHA